MTDPGPVLYPFDGSSLAEEALPFAARIARGARAPLVLIQAVESAEARVSAERDVEALAGTLWEEGLGVEAHVRLGPPGPVIADAAARWGASMVVMSTHGRGGLGRLLHGSVATYAVRHAPVPVMLIPPGCTCRWPADDKRRARILVPLDGSPFAEAAIHPGVALARALGGDVVFARVVDPSTFYRWSGFEPITPGRSGGTVAEIQEADARGYLTAIANSALTPEVNVGTVTRIGDPLAELTLLAGAYLADVIVAATHGRGGLSRLVMGSVAAGLLRRTGLPVLFVHPLARARERPEAARSQPALAGSSAL
jgi:nucleotide-binding universal stress UspA family protein